ncbi:hypothetical protein Q4488_18460 [Amphritea sp. 1_MG-2023]|uniref:hypothetical protein n=1 Tax=Amphritea sp. 1_MG-2023 TaxID=3062670 RepID=UPI0026E47955|nr:hypothetical protein [Amphritea sp. 1_MG-2023]MDO6565358.1 hypothetical protein [Amphritea sp. 1_MG-2023]
MTALLPIALLSALVCHASESASLSCDADETPAYVIVYEHYVTRMIDEQPDKQGRQVVIATPETRYYEETGERLTRAASQHGDTDYTPYRKVRWETQDAVYTYLSTDNIARVRRQPLREISLTPYAMPSVSGATKTLMGYACHWHEEALAGVQKTQRCEAVFFGWLTPLYTRTIAAGRDVVFSEATDISQRCINKASLYVPQDKAWRFSE